MKQLLNKNLSKRIKPKDIPYHPFFKGLDFSVVETMNFIPPIVPKIVSKIELTNFILKNRKMKWIILT